MNVCNTFSSEFLCNFSENFFVEYLRGCKVWMIWPSWDKNKRKCSLFPWMYCIKIKAFWEQVVRLFPSVVVQLSTRCPAHCVPNFSSVAYIRNLKGPYIKVSTWVRSGESSVHTVSSFPGDRARGAPSYVNCILTREANATLIKLTRIVFNILSNEMQLTITNLGKEQVLSKTAYDSRH